MKKLFLSLGLAFALSGISHAKTPPEVLKPYKEYRVALKAGDIKLARKQALKAWDKAEEVLGDSKITGDLAYNFAEIQDNASSVAVRSKLGKKRKEAYLRSAELAKFYEEDPEEIEIQRRLKHAQLDVFDVNIHRRGKVTVGGSKSKFRKIEALLENANLQDSTYMGELETMKAKYYEVQGKHGLAVEHATKAINIFDTAKLRVASAYPFLVKVIRGNNLRQNDEKIKAALDYQDVMQNLEGHLEADHPLIKQAFTSWMLTRNELEDENKLAEAEAAGLCECWPFENYKDKIIPLERIPPMMPRNAKRSGHVTLLFDVSDDGFPENIKVTGRTDAVFEKPAISSVKKWRYSSRTEEETGNSRDNVATKITFTLTNRSGNLLKEGPYILTSEN